MLLSIIYNRLLTVSIYCYCQFPFINTIYINLVFIDKNKLIVTI
ncbi:unnamed protein product [Schistosoma margrebowiei]|uniref:Uncharacterized protein n=1 Tax=Schistosoma margrebowiei TaxID=48269 RepID=A0A183N937_9TREM|nr:unnamed protein product [Schistosoma margrebowiei]